MKNGDKENWNLYPSVELKNNRIYTTWNNQYKNDSEFYFVIWSNVMELGGLTGTEKKIEGNFSNFVILNQNYPNPFNSSTTIKYSIPIPPQDFQYQSKGDREVQQAAFESLQEVRLNVYDILGREVAVLVNELKKPGNYEIEFTGNDLSSGNYFYVLQTNGFIQTKKFILLK